MLISKVKATPRRFYIPDYLGMNKQMNTLLIICSTVRKGCWARARSCVTEPFQLLTLGSLDELPAPLLGHSEEQLTHLLQTNLIWLVKSVSETQSATADGNIRVYMSG